VTPRPGSRRWESGGEGIQTKGEYGWLASFARGTQPWERKSKEEQEVEVSGDQ
jgi:hypothetical protein